MQSNSKKFLKPKSKSFSPVKSSYLSNNFEYIDVDTNLSDSEYMNKLSGFKFLFTLLTYLKMKMLHRQKIMEHHVIFRHFYFNNQ